MYKALDTFAGWLARVCALLGGTVLLVVTTITCISIIGRALNFLGLGPVQGDFEIVEIGVGFAIFAFLPWCQYARGHARVDLFTTALGDLPNRLIDLVADLLMFAAAVIIAWRLYIGMLDKYRYLETTFILQFPTWIGYAAAMVGAVIFVVVAAFCILRSLVALKGETHEQL